MKGMRLLRKLFYMQYDILYIIIYNMTIYNIPYRVTYDKCIFFSHTMWFRNRDAVCFPIGKLTRYLRQPPKVVHELTPDGVRVLETLPPSYHPISIPADIPPIEEYR